MGLLWPSAVNLIWILLVLIVGSFNEDDKHWANQKPRVTCKQKLILGASLTNKSTSTSTSTSVQRSVLSRKQLRHLRELIPVHRNTLLLVKIIEIQITLPPRKNSHCIKSFFLSMSSKSKAVIGNSQHCWFKIIGNRNSQFSKTLFPSSCLPNQYKLQYLDKN